MVFSARPKLGSYLRRQGSGPTSQPPTALSPTPVDFNGMPQNSCLVLSNLGDAVMVRDVRLLYFGRPSEKVMTWQRGSGAGVDFCQAG
jgi:hypothetical protein